MILWAVKFTGPSHLFFTHFIKMAINGSNIVEEESKETDEKMVE